MSLKSSISNSLLAYWGIRIAFGVSLFTHGAIRLPKWSDFAQGMAGQFEPTFLAGWPALTFAYLIPLAEVLIGLTILAGGRFIRWGAFAGCLLMGGIMFGTCILEKWELLASQLIHLALFYAILLNPHTPGSDRTA
ncbi:MAG TPA: MauE/DoxX family redox-associated membrane protein [Opitutales bacterium]|nr:MauE/DoxX family redox-associated membrane protein [Opitutales bacterium]